VSESRLERITTRLQEHLAPDNLEVIDESHLHVGHAGAADGRGHFRVSIVSEHFEGLMPLARHRLVFSTLEDMMKTDIHALSVTAVAPSDTSEA
jgi:BolA protein